MTTKQDLSIFTLPNILPSSIIFYGPDEQNNCSDVFLPSLLQQCSQQPMIILIHGGYWKTEVDRKYMRHLGNQLKNKGYLTINIQYRRILGQPDVYIQDTSNAIIKLTKQINQYNGQIVLIGHSVGGYLALHAQLSSKLSQNIKITKSILLAPVLNLQKTQQLKIQNDVVTNYIGGLASQRKDIDPFCLPFPKSQTVIIQGDIDLRVPVELTRQYLYSRENFGKCSNIKYIELKNIGHFQIVNPNFQEIFNLILDEIKNIR